jgi:transposase
MRRIIVATESSKLAQLCEEYWAFRKRQPLLLARIPQQIKLDAKSQLEAGVSIHELASKLGVQVGTLRGWMRSVGWSQTDVQTLTEPKTIEDAIKTLKSEYARLREPSLAPAQKRENTKKLGAMAKELIEFGSGVEEISKALGVHHMTVRLWLKSLQEKPESVETLEKVEDELPPAQAEELNAAFVEEASSSAAEPLPMATEAEQHEHQKVDQKASTTAFEPKPDQVDELLQPSDPEGRTTQSSEWIRVRIAGQVLEMSWADLMKREAAAARSRSPEAPVPVQQKSRLPRIHVDPDDDFNRMATEDCNFQNLIERFEALVISNAIARHQTLGDAADALEIPRSTFDSKRRRLGLT